MQIIKITDKKQLNKFVAGQKNSQFLQSWEWGEFQKKVSGKVWRLGVEQDGKLVVAATLIKKTLPMGKSYFYYPRGPVGQTDSKQAARQLKILFNKIGELAKNEGVMFLRFEPQFSPSLTLPRSSVPATTLGTGAGEGTIFKTIDVQPSKTLILDLSKSEEELLENMHQKTRYNIRLAVRKDVSVHEVGFDKFNEFWKIMQQTVKRDNFRLYSKEYYKKMLEIGNKYVKLIVAKYDNKIIAGNIMIFFGNTATYVHGASSDNYRNTMAPYALQWHCIKLAKKQGYEYYDFNGIDEKKWPGVTRFKKGFSGKEVNYPGTFDLIFNKAWYSAYKLIRKIRRIF